MRENESELGLIFQHVENTRVHNHYPVGIARCIEALFVNKIELEKES